MDKQRQVRRTATGIFAMVGVDPEHYVTENGSGAVKMRLRPAEPTDTVVAHQQGGSVGSLTIVSTKAKPTRRTREALAALNPKAGHGVLTLVPRPASSTAVVQPSAQTALPRQREQRPTGGKGARSPGSEDSEPPRDPLAPRPCVNCGEEFKPARAAQTYCLEDECRRARKTANKRGERQRDEAPRLDPELVKIARRARRAIRAGADPALALSFVVWPPDSVREAA